MIEKEPAPQTRPSLSESLNAEQAQLSESYLKALNQADNAHTRMVAAKKALKRLETSTDADAREAARQESEQLTKGWEASKGIVARMGERLEKSGVDLLSEEFGKKVDRDRLLNSLRVRQLREDLQTGARRVAEIAHVDNAPELPPDAAADWETERTDPAKTTPRKPAEPTLIPPPPHKPGFLEGLGKMGRRTLLPIMFLLGLESATGEKPQQKELPAPEREVPQLTVAKRATENETPPTPEFSTSQMESGRVKQGDGILKILERQGLSQQQALEAARLAGIVRSHADTRLTTKAIDRLSIIPVPAHGGGLEIKFIDTQTNQTLTLEEAHEAGFTYEFGN